MARGLPTHRPLVTVAKWPGLWRIVRWLPVVPPGEWCPMCRTWLCARVVLRRPHEAEELRARECQVSEVKP